MIRLGILAGTCFLLLIGFGAQAGTVKPCSQRYSQVYSFSLNAAHANSGWESVLDKWDVRQPWGLEQHVTFPLLKKGTFSSPAMRVTFPKGSVNPSNKMAPRGGAGFYATGGFPPSSEVACLRYQVYFPHGFDFVKGGKLPGLYGGIPPSGCIQNENIKGFSTRYMWRADGAGTAYLYTPNKFSRCGELVGYRHWYFPTGEWLELEQEVVLNTPGKEDGMLRVWVNGWPVISRYNVAYRRKSDVYISGMMFNTFFGGDDASWATPRDQEIYFSNFQAFFPRAEYAQRMP